MEEGYDISQAAIPYDSLMLGSYRSSGFLVNVLFNECISVRLIVVGGEVIL